MRQSRVVASRALAVAAAVAMSVTVLNGCTSTGSTGAASTDTGQPSSSQAPVVLPGAPGDEPRVAGSAEMAELGAEQAEPSEAGIDYIRMMIPHHRQALTMTDMAPARAKNPRVRGLAERIGGAQQAEIDMMQAWLKRNDLQPVTDYHVDARHKRMMGMATREQLDRLKGSSGTEFDRLFLRLMSRHHEGAVTMAEDLLTKGTDPQVRSMAKDVIASQRDEIATMQQLLTEIG
ncbi:uncharacterized protein (DUF305 family) [Halopolyspora algeriensis]|uniref:Uncharacterized protein (DUF305 family) n=1 Tax=Halopolyspora algeriensis TaxID=1500506 RepID=A0A368VQ54_9ACTN|nr:DUF305 domain-containing protein [Halopolyspora algeriensis]RCW43155.1 uncharacterized protein (DUF305 family) [Halopolyspora algeriensis]TQM56213.1 uncharacterized protein (DUF305 family) [Halopolyspora algeriensis]